MPASRDGLLDFDCSFVGGEGAIKQHVSDLGLAKARVGDLRPAWAAIHNGDRSNPLLRAGRLRNGITPGASSSGGADTVPFVQITREQFKSHGQRGGAAWPGYDNEPRYQVIKEKYGGGLDRMLRWTEGHERLFPSLVEPGHPEHVFESSPLRCRMGTRVPYALRHQLGQGIQPFDKVPLPKRPLIAITTADFDGWMRAIQRHIEGEGELRAARVRL